MAAFLPSPLSPALHSRRLHLISSNTLCLSPPSSSAIRCFNICRSLSQIPLPKSQKLIGIFKVYVRSPLQFLEYNCNGRTESQVKITQRAVIWRSFSLQLRKLLIFSSQCWLLLVNCGPKLRLYKWRLKLGFSALVTQLAIGMMIIVLVSVPLTNAPSWALSEENILFLEAWRTIDRAYFDKTFNGQSWFRYREEALRNEPMNTRAETYAAIRKMLATLDDPFTRFLEPEKFKSLRSGTQGALTGVGLSIGYPFGIDESSSTGLAVISSTPGGPADREGITTGDIILAIDGTSTESMGLYDAAERLQQSSRKSLTDPISLENIDLTDDWVVEAEDDGAPLLDVDEIDDLMDVADAILDEGEGGATAGGGNEEEQGDEDDDYI